MAKTATTTETATTEKKKKAETAKGEKPKRKEGEQSVKSTEGTDTKTETADLSNLDLRLPSQMIPLSQLEQHPDNDKFRIYTKSRQEELDAMVSARPEDAALRPLKAVPAVAEDGTPVNNEAGDQLYWLIGGNHQLESYRKLGLTEAPVIIRPAMSRSDQLLFMGTDNKVKPFTALELGRLFNLYLESKGGPAGRGRPKKGEERPENVAAADEFARAMGVSRNTVEAAGASVDLFDSFDKKIQKKIIEAEDFIGPRHYRAIRKLPKPERARFMDWACEVKPSVKELENSIALFLNKMNSTDYVQQSLGTLLSEPPAPVKGIEIPKTPPAVEKGEAGGAAGGQGTVEVGGDRVSPGKDTVRTRDQAFKEATAGVGRANIEPGEEEVAQAIKNHMDDIAKNLIDTQGKAKAKLTGDHLQSVQQHVLTSLDTVRKAWADMELTLDLDAGDDDADEDDEDADNANGNGAAPLSNTAADALAEAGASA